MGLRSSYAMHRSYFELLLQGEYAGDEERTQPKSIWLVSWPEEGEDIDLDDDFV
jgi:hypothetical protein